MRRYAARSSSAVQAGTVGEVHHSHVVECSHLGVCSARDGWQMVRGRFQARRRRRRREASCRRVRLVMREGCFFGCNAVRWDVVRGSLSVECSAPLLRDQSIEHRHSRHFALLQGL